MPRRSIKRIAFLQEYRNRPETLKELLPEVAEKGYHAAAFSATIGKEQFIVELAEEAERVGLEVMAFTGFMKYQEAWLKDHPEQKLVLATDLGAEDQDQLSVHWGCPFNPEFQKRYFDFLASLGRIPNLTEAWINDEAYLGFDEKRLGCYCPICREAWAGEFGGGIPRPPFKDQPEKAQFVHWRFRRWNEVHRKMRAALNIDHSVRAIFLSNPPCCIGLNPWISAVNLPGMLEVVDGVMTDPYYTFHDVSAYTRSMPREIYLSEYCRYLRGMAGEDKLSEICAQGFSHPTFTRPFDEQDGWWAGVIPLALGINNVTAYTYALQKISPMQKTYEAAFQLDSYFARTQPVDFIAVVDSLETQCFHMDAAAGGGSWKLSRMIPLADTMRHHALPYTYISSQHLEIRDLRRWPVLVLPGVSCLSGKTKEALREYVATGGILVACGETATRDKIGRVVADSFMEEVFGIASQLPCEAAFQFSETGEHPAFADIPWPDEITAQYMDGTNIPVLGLSHAVAVEISDETQALARFNPDGGMASDKPALTIHSFGKGTAIYCAGSTERVFVRPEFGKGVINHAGRVLAHLIREMALDKLPLRAKSFPPRVPMQELRPLDRRLMPTVEFMPCIGDNLYLATIASYFKEPMTFPIEAVLPEGKICREVRELVSNQPIDEIRRKGNGAEIDVNLGFQDCIKVFAFILE